jgi:hypothetical protein
VVFGEREKSAHAIAREGDGRVGALQVQQP